MRRLRELLGQRIRALRKQRSWSQQALGRRSKLSGKFIGEVERGQKSISLDSLYRVSVALEVPLRELTDVRSQKDPLPSEDVEQVFTLLSRRRPPEALRQAYEVLRAVFGEAAAR